MKTRLMPHLIWASAVILAYGSGRWQTNRTADSTTTNTVSLQSEGAGSSLLGTSRLADKDAIDSDATPIGHSALSHRDLQALATESITSPNPLTRSKAFAKLLESLTPENALEIMKALQDGRADRDQRDLFRYAWASIDPQGALANALSMEGRDKQHAVGETITGWASTNPEDAKAWVDAVENDKERSRYREDLVSGMADHDIGEATDYVFELAEQGDREADDYLEAVTREQLRKGPTKDAMRWAESMPDGKLKGQAMDSVAGRLVGEDPEGAAAWATRFVNEPYAERVIEEVGDEWAERDPEASVAWLRSLPEGDAQAEGLASALDEWVDRDPLAASEFLTSMDTSPMKDSAIGGFARSIARKDPEAAVLWASTIEQEKLRIETLERTAREWFRRDADAATSWLDNSGLPTQTQDNLRKLDKRS